MPSRIIPLVAHAASGAQPARATAPAMRDAGWVERLRQTALVIFPALVVFCVVVPWLAGRIFWTITIAALPLFIVVGGYHRWRRICPLAFAAQLPTRLGFPGRRLAGRWLQTHAYHVSFGALFVSLWIRLVATNGDGYMLALFLGAIVLAAIAVDATFTGKTWCNYVCPISFVERIYTEPRNLYTTPNSQCEKCTACKPVCPDINEENSYWKEIRVPAKRHVYFAFPGLVFAFYAYYWVQAGTWEYYFGGRWTNEIGLVRTAFAPGTGPATAGVYFWPAIPRALAAALTLAVGAGGSYVLFSVLDRLLHARFAKSDRPADDASVRHLTFTIAAFTAFVTFYSYAGAPTLRLVTALPHFFQLLVVTTATLFLVRRFTRSHAVFVEETLARQILAKWPWHDVAPPRDLREAFLVHRIRSQSNREARTRALEQYKEAVRDTVASGLISRLDVHQLEIVRDQMHISEADHERVMAELAEEERDLGPAVTISPEKQLQLATYGDALAVHVARWRAAAHAIDDATVTALREEYGVTEQEHAQVLDRLVRRNEGVAAHLMDVPATIAALLATLDRLEAIRSPATRFLGLLLQRRAERVADGLLRTIGSSAAEVRAIREGLLARDVDARAAAVTALAARVPPALAERLMAAQHRAQSGAGRHPDLASCLRAQFSSPEPYIRAAALYALESIDAVTAADCTALDDDEHPIVQETVASARAVVGDQTVRAESTTLTKMIGLKSIDMFSELDPEDLAQIARTGEEAWFTEGQALCRQGEMGDAVFVLLTGEVTIRRRDQGAERVIGVEGPGSVIGELAVLDPAPRFATVVASTVAVRTLRLSGAAFREALGASPAVSEVVLRMLARRLRSRGTDADEVADRAYSGDGGRREAPSPANR